MMISSDTKIWLGILFNGSIEEFEQSGFKEKLDDYLVEFSKTLVEIPASLKVDDHCSVLVRLGELKLTNANFTIKLDSVSPIPNLFINHIVPRFSTWIRGFKIKGDWTILEDFSPLEYNRARIAFITTKVEAEMNLLDKDKPQLAREDVEKLMIIRVRHDP